MVSMNTSNDLTVLTNQLDQKGLVQAFDTSDELIQRMELWFANGWGASIVRGVPGGLLAEALPLEGAVLDATGSISYDTPITPDVVRLVSDEHFLEFLREVSELPKIG